MKKSTLGWLLALSLGVWGCHPVRTVRMERGLRLFSGPPRNGCERDGWLEVARTRAFSQVTRSVGGGYGYTRYRRTTRQRIGLAVYRWNDQHKALPAKTLLKLLQDAQLMDRHLDRIEPILRRHSIAQAMMWAGLGATLVGTGVMLAALSVNPGPNDALFYVMMFGGGGVVVLGSISALVYLAIRPSGHALTFALIRNKLFLRREDDLRRLMRAVDQANLQTRRRCGGKSIPGPKAPSGKMSILMDSGPL